MRAAIADVEQKRALLEQAQLVHHLQRGRVHSDFMKVHVVILPVVGRQVVVLCSATVRCRRVMQAQIVSDLVRQDAAERLITTSASAIVAAPPRSCAVGWACDADSGSSTSRGPVPAEDCPR